MNMVTGLSQIVSRSFVMRTGCFLGLWIVIAGTKPADLVAGFIAALVAAIVSVQLLPPSQRRVRFILLAQLVFRFFRQAIVAGIDVAWRALHPRLPLHPGFVIYEPQSPPGELRSAFLTVTSLLPGTLPTDTDEHGRILVHCLDTTQPVAEQLAREEAFFLQALGGTSRDG